MPHPQVTEPDIRYPRGCLWALLIATPLLICAALVYRLCTA